MRGRHEWSMFFRLMSMTALDDPGDVTATCPRAVAVRLTLLPLATRESAAAALHQRYERQDLDKYRELLLGKLDQTTKSIDARFTAGGPR